jgi:uncharacterized membrane protein
MKASLDKAGIVHQDQALRQAAGQAFYNMSKFTLRDLKARASQQQQYSAILCGHRFSTAKARIWIIGSGNGCPQGGPRAGTRIRRYLPFWAGPASKGEGVV